MSWQNEFINTFYEVVHTENTVLSSLNRSRVGYHRYGRGVRDLAEVHLQYLLFRALLSNSYFDRWCVEIWTPYGRRKNTKSRRLHVDFSLTKTRYGKEDDSSWTAIEMKRWDAAEARKDYERLQSMSNNRGLLIYRFGQRPVDLGAQIEESFEFRRLMRKFEISAPGDCELDVADSEGGRLRYHFAAVLLTW